jgi:hypothetical protein
LNNAVQAFKAKVKTNGTKTSGFTQEQLTALIGAAETAKQGVATSVNGADISSGVFWVTQEVMTAFNTAINNAKTANAATDTTTRDTLYTALGTARTAFNAAKQPGSKTGTGTGAKTVTITGLSDYNGATIYVELFATKPTQNSKEEDSPYGDGTIKNGSATVPLYSYSGSASSFNESPWTGNGNWYVGFFIEDDANELAYVTKTTKSFSSNVVTVTLADCEAMDPGDDPGKGPGGNESGNTPAFDMYIAGASFQWIEDEDSEYTQLWYWINGKKIDLPVIGSGGGGTGRIIVSGSDVYVAGFYDDTNVKGKPCYWKNGVLHTLPFTGTDDSAYAITVSGSDVYVAGTYYTNSEDKPCYWKNGVQTLLPITGAGGSAEGIVVSGSDVYILGYDDVDYDSEPCYWKNNAQTFLPYTGMEGRVTEIAVSGSDVYISGYCIESMTYTPCYWKNGVQYNLPYTEAGGRASSITVSGSDVYIAGEYIRNDYYSESKDTTPCYWKNGVQHSLAFPAYGTEGHASGIAVSGSDVYVAGEDYTNLDYEIDDVTLAFWLNGERIILPFDLSGINGWEVTGFAFVLR